MVRSVLGVWVCVGVTGCVLLKPGPISEKLDALGGPNKAQGEVHRAHSGSVFVARGFLEADSNDTGAVLSSPVDSLVGLKAHLALPSSVSKMARASGAKQCVSIELAASVDGKSWHSLSSWALDDESRDRVTFFGLAPVLPSQEYGDQELHPFVERVLADLGPGTHEISLRSTAVCAGGASPVLGAGSLSVTYGADGALADLLAYGHAVSPGLNLARPDMSPAVASSLTSTLAQSGSTLRLSRCLDDWLVLRHQITNERTKRRVNVEYVYEDADARCYFVTAIAYQPWLDGKWGDLTVETTNRSIGSGANQQRVLCSPLPTR